MTILLSRVRGQVTLPDWQNKQQLESAGCGRCGCRTHPDTCWHGPEHALPVHGGEALPIYYGEHLRTSWYGIAPGQHINADPLDQVNDFPSLFVILEAGTARTRLDGREMPLEDHQAIYAPEGMSHEFWNPGEERATLILIMFGESA